MTYSENSFDRAIIARKDGKKLALYTVQCKFCTWKVAGLPWALDAAEHAHVCAKRRPRLFLAFALPKSA